MLSLFVVYRNEEPALTNMDISTGHMVLVSAGVFRHEIKTYARPNFIFSVWHFSMSSFFKSEILDSHVIV